MNPASDGGMGMGFWILIFNSDIAIGAEAEDKNKIYR